MDNSTTIDSPALSSKIKSKSFIGLLGTQFLGSFNDNMFRWLSVSIAKEEVGQIEALTIGLVCFTLPYILLASPSGFFSDKFSKRSVIISCKVAEIFIMLAGLLSIYTHNIYMLFGVVAIMGTQSALFSPAKYGSIPEILPDHELSNGNAWMGLVTIVSAALGCVAGTWIQELVIPDGSLSGIVNITPAAIALLSVAGMGFLTSLMIERLAPADPSRKNLDNPIKELKLLYNNKALFRAALGIAFFWMLASLANLNIDQYGLNELHLNQREVGPLLAILVVGVAIGSLLAGKWSAGRIELGIVPLGAVGIAFSAMFLYLNGISTEFISGFGISGYYISAVLLVFLGIASGLFDIPLESFLQHRSDVQSRGSIIAASNFITFSGILIVTGLFYLMNKLLNMSPSQIFLVTGLGTIVVAYLIYKIIPQSTIRCFVWLMSHTLYRVRVCNRENLPAKGGALLVSNHVSWLDGILLLMTSSRNIRMIAYGDYISEGIAGWLSRLYGVIPIRPEDGPKSIIRSLQSARKAILNGELVCIFAEGQITRTGQLQPFQKGLMKIIKGVDAPIIPVYLDELWGSIFSYKDGKFFWKKPRQWPYPVSINFGPAIRNPETIDQVRNAVELLGVKSVEQRKDRTLIPARHLIRKCKVARFRSKVADSGGVDITGGKLLTGSLLFKKLLEKHVFEADEKFVGILLPPSVGGFVANTAVALSNKVSVNLNYTLSSQGINFCIKDSNIKHVITSKRVMEKMNFDLDAEIVYLEDLKEKATAIEKISSLLDALITPTAILERKLGLTKISPDEILTIIYTSGSTGNPKGVMLSHHNIQTNVDGIAQMVRFTNKDVFLGILPFFHSFGFMGTLWLVATIDLKGIYHFNPLDARQIGKLSKKHKATIMTAAPTFLRTYLKRVEEDQFEHLDVVIVGSEKMPIELAKAFKEKFDVEPSEAYGVTECSPGISSNVSAHRAGNSDQLTTRLGTVGRVFPGVSVKIVDPDSKEDLGTNRDGLIWVKGPNVMKGYLNMPEKTAEVLIDGWYNTGDIGNIDDDGFIQITGRLSRFSKIGGEMIPHIKIEASLSHIVEDPDSDEPEVKIAVTSLPDPKKGEKIIVVHKPLKLPIDEILTKLSDEGFPNLWIPNAENFLKVDEIPMLGTGKLDLKGLNDLVKEKLG